MCMCTVPYVCVCVSDFPSVPGYPGKLTLFKHSVRTKYQNLRWTQNSEPMKNNTKKKQTFSLGAYFLPAADGTNDEGEAPLAELK